MTHTFRENVCASLSLRIFTEAKANVAGRDFNLESHLVDVFLRDRSQIHELSSAGVSVLNVPRIARIRTSTSVVMGGKKADI